jgi:uncharacterized membrane protein YczE
MEKNEQGIAHPGDAVAGAVRFLIMAAGFWFLAFGFALVIQAGLGVAPWTTLHLGLTNYLPLTVGQTTQLVGLLVLLGALALKVRPRLGTWLNMAAVGLFLDLILAAGLIPAATGFAARWGYLAAGSALAALGMSGCLSADLGAGPRDSLMLGLVQATGRPVGQVRIGLDLCAVTTGYAMGGPVGLGTVVSALLIGPCVQVWLNLLTLIARRTPAGRVLRPPPVRGSRMLPPARAEKPAD